MKRRLIGFRVKAELQNSRRITIHCNTRYTEFIRFVIRIRYRYRWGTHLDVTAKTDLPIIVWWTPFTPHKRIVRECPAGQCPFTQSRTEINNPSPKPSCSTVILWTGKLFLGHETLATTGRFSTKSRRKTIGFLPPSLAFHFLIFRLLLAGNQIIRYFLNSIDVLERATRVTTARKSKQDANVALVSYLQSDCNLPSCR